MSLAFQQTLPNFLFQSFDLPAQRGLREKNFPRGAADVAFLSHRNEVTQLSEVHAASMRKSRAQAKNWAFAEIASSDHPGAMKTTADALIIRQAVERGQATMAG